MKLNKITVVDLDIDGRIWVHGDEKSVCFERVVDGGESDNGIELTREELAELVLGN